MANRPSARRGPSGAWNRLRPVAVDPLDAYGLPSKGETRLHNYKTQEAYYSKIVERYMKFCASSNNGEDLEAAFASLSVKDKAPTTASNHNRRPGQIDSRPQLPHRSSPSNDDLALILLAMRKLREGILGSSRRDHFAQRAYMFIIHASILTKSWEAYQPALPYLLNHIHRDTPLSKPELQEFAGYQVLDLACRQNELLEAYILRLRYKLRDRRIDTILNSLVHEDWTRFWRAKRAVDGYQRTIMDFAAPRIRQHALTCLGRSYMSADKAFVERSGDQTWEELVKGGVGWQLQENGSVLIRKPKPK